MQGHFSDRLTLEPNDMLLWLRFKGLFSSAPELAILDFWSCRASFPVAITNRSADLPEWFELHPTEAAGPLAHQMMRRLEAGHKPGVPVEGPNIWRILAGDRLVHCGRPTSAPARIDGLLAIYSFRENAAVTAEHHADSIEDWISFGAPDHGAATPAELRAGRSAVAAVRGLGPPREVATFWALEL